MANIVTPFASGEQYSSSARAKCISIAEYWLGSGATSSVSTWGDYHTLINPVLTEFGITNISDGDTGQEWLDRMNLATIVEQETVDLVARFTSAPTGGRKVHIQKLIKALKDGGIWTKLDALYLFAAADSQAARLNWVADQYNITAVNAPTFTTDRGYAGDGASSHLNTNFNPATAVSPKFVRDSGHVSLSDRTARAANGTLQMGGAVVNDFAASIVSRFTGDIAGGRINAPGATALTYANTENVGRYMMSRTGASALATYKDGVSKGTSTTASVAVPSTDIIIGAFINNGVVSLRSSDQFSQASIGSGLDAADVTVFDAAIAAYLTAVGA